MTGIRAVGAWEILDSRGNPTLAVAVELTDGARATAMVPSGASTGRHEAVDLRDGDPQRYRGLGVRKAVANVNDLIGPALRGLDVTEQAVADRRMIELDSTPDKSYLGANAMLGVSCAVARAAARSRGLFLWQSLADGRAPLLPVPMINILSGGLHAGRNIEFQDFLAIPHGFDSYAEALEAAAAIHHAARQIVEQRGYILTGVADEGGWGPRLSSNEEALEILTAAIERAGYRPSDQVSIAIDVAASHFFRGGLYELTSERRTLTAAEMVDQLESWCGRFPVMSVEDGLDQDDWSGWQLLTRRLGGHLQLIGDDLFATNPTRLARGITDAAATSVLVKMNQIGTLTETFLVIDQARAAGFSAVISARSGETEDSFLADLAVASGSGQIKIGSITRSERLAKYNRLLEIERGGALSWPGRRFREVVRPKPQ